MNIQNTGGITLKNYKKEKFKSKDEWIKSRGLGGTSASAITGNSPYKNILELYSEIVCPSEVEVEKLNDSMTYGTLMEPLIRKIYALDFKHKYKMHTPRQYEMYRRTDKPYMTATLDGVLTEIKENRKGIWECKTHDIRNREDELEWKDHIPQKYYEQVIWYLVVLTDFEFVEVTAKLNFFDYYDPEGKKLLRSETRFYHIERADVFKHVENLEKLVTRFWEKNVMGGTIPDYKIKF